MRHVTDVAELVVNKKERELAFTISMHLVIAIIF
jgi:hypothetical protein